MIRVIIAEDETILRNGLKTIIEQDEEICVCGLATNGQEAYDLCIRERPDVVLMDMSMPHGNGDEVTRKIKEVLPEIKVLIYTVFDDKKSVTAALAGGADGYILKGVDGDQVISSIKNIIYEVGSVSTKVFEALKDKMHSEMSPTPLTDNEVQLISLIALGDDYKEIAAKMFVSEGTVRNNTSKLLRKLGLKNRAQLAAYAVRYGLD